MRECFIQSCGLCNIIKSQICPSLIWPNLYKSIIFYHDTTIELYLLENIFNSECSELCTGLRGRLANSKKNPAQERATKTKLCSHAKEICGTNKCAQPDIQKTILAQKDVQPLLKNLIAPMGSMSKL